jgi:hypothetical protein
MYLRWKIYNMDTKDEGEIVRLEYSLGSETQSLGQRDDTQQAQWKHPALQEKTNQIITKPQACQKELLQEYG